MRINVNYCFLPLIIVSHISLHRPGRAAAIKRSAPHHITHHFRTIPPAKTDSTVYTGASTGDVEPLELIDFARTLLGTRYRSGSTDPARGFDCSGFVNYVFNHFGINIPRSSVDFTSYGQEVDLKDARAGDIILFTGTASGSRTAGHVGIVVSCPGEDVKFIHSTSGKAWGVTETQMNDYYMGRFMRVIRLFPQGDI